MYGRSRAVVGRFGGISQATWAPVYETVSVTSGSTGEWKSWVHDHMNSKMQRITPQKSEHRFSTDQRFYSRTPGHSPMLSLSPFCCGQSLALQRSAWPTVRLLLLRPKVSIAQKSDPIRTILLGLEDAREILGAAFGREINGDGHFAINIANPGRKHV